MENCIFNKALGVFVAVPEFASAHGKSTQSSNDIVGRSTAGGSTVGGVLKTAITRLAFMIGIALSINSAYAQLDAGADGTVVVGNEEPGFTDPTADFKDPNGNRYTTSKSIRIGKGKTLDGANNQQGAVALGLDTVSSALRTIAIGWNAEASNPTAPAQTSIGNTGNEAIAIGAFAKSQGTQSIAFGSRTLATGNQSTAIGNNSVASGHSSVAIGGDDLNLVSKADGQWNQSTAAKKFKQLTGNELIENPAAPYIATKANNGAVAVGVQAAANAELSTAFGTRSQAAGTASMALGVGAKVDSAYENAVAIGAGSLADS